MPGPVVLHAGNAASPFSLPAAKMLGMALALSIFGTAFAAFCVWLTVRIINRRERWAKRMAVLLVVFVSYPLSLAPAFWIHPYLPDPAQDAMRLIYEPLHWVAATLFGIGNG